MVSPVRHVHYVDGDSDEAISIATTDLQIVMAEQIARDVVKEAQSMGNALPIDETAKPTNTTSADDGTSSTTKNLLATTPPDALSTESGLNGITDDASHADTSVILNGTSDHLATDDVLLQSAVADISGGSDTDTSRDLGKESGRGHARTGSVKKPTFFKSTSVTKTFLAKAASTTPPVPGTKATPTSQGSLPSLQSAKPRLVAKSGSGLGNIQRSGLSKANGASGGPDASKVWNKNRPVPPQPQKQFTDEELKQQYGIHMATRLQADDPGKDQSKWADIDDDEEDWAPETVEWMDGTKSTVAVVENAPPVEEVKPAPPKPAAPVETIPVRPPAPTASPAPAVQRPDSTSGSKTILKPGISTPGSQPKSGSLVLKGGPEKPALVSKSPAPQPAKSPWAPLPPFEKVPPVQINPLAQQPQQSRFAQRDAHGFDALPPLSSSAAKEIAADDFSRTWREERGTKELFNSHSGRYEPVNETRRGSIRDRESAYRQPVIQRRPDGLGPAEPSAAFQTSRSGAETGPWSRRRTSSNVSGGSGRRMSFGRPQEGPPLLGDPQLRRGSHSVTESDGTPSEGLRPNFGQQRYQPHDIPGPPQHAWAQRQSPAVSNAQPVSPYGSIHSQSGMEHANAMGPPPVPAPDPVAVQQQVMKDNIERARQAKQRRDEEEAKAEAEKKARIEKLMAKLEPAQKAEKPAASNPTPASEVAASKDKPAALSSPPKPPVPTHDGEVAQYGMIKVHPSTTVKKLSPPMDGHVPPAKDVHGPSQTRPTDVPARSITSSLSPAQTSKIDEAGVSTQNSEAGPSRVQKSDGQAPRSTHISPNSSQEPQATWKPQAAPEPFQPWGNAGPAQAPRASSNVWGPLQSHDRALGLGNGTFEPSYHPGLPRHNAPTNNQGPQAGPGPIAPPSKLSPVASHAVPHPSQSLEQQRIFPPHADIRLPPVAPIGAPSPNQTNPQSTPPGPIAPPTRNMAATQTRAPFGVSDWTNLAGNAGRHDAELIAKRQEKIKNQAGFAPQLEETFKKTVPGSRIGERRVVKTEQYVYDQDNPNAPAVQVEPGRERSDYPPPISGPAPVNQYMGNQSMPQQQAAVLHAQQVQPGKSSRFFPTTSGNKGTATVNGGFADSDSDSPPPPETCTANHPAWDGESNHPKVNLPVPKAVVKLPPVPQSSASAVVMPPRPPPMGRVGSQPIVTSTAWQDRFNGLFGKVSAAQPAQASPNAPAAVVSSVSKTSFDSTPQRSLATVSLPSQSESSKNFRRTIFATDGSKEIVSKHSAEEELLEDREFGSLPAVRISKPDYVNKDLMNFPMMFERTTHRYPQKVESASGLELDFPEEQNSAGYVLHILVPNSKRAASTKILPRNLKARKSSGFSANKKKNYNARDGGSFNSGYANHSGPRPRKASTNQHSQSSAPAGSPRTNTHRNNPWNNEGNNRSTSTPSHPWSGKRPGAAAVH